MDILTLLVVLIVGAALIYWLPQTQKVVYFVWAVCALIWLFTILGVIPVRVTLR